MLRHKAMIIIAVSNYAGAYSDLPGAVTSARGLRDWAEQPGEDRNYKVLYLVDDVYDKIDVKLVCEKVSEFINNNIIDRLVVYFAGHGIVRSAGAQFWLLTNAAKDHREGIDVDGFKRGLLKCNIGTHNDNLVAGQLCIIGDACRNIDRDAIEFKGDAILTERGGMNGKIQFDRFLSTRLGDYSFQIDGDDDQNGLVGNSNSDQRRATHTPFILQYISTFLKRFTSRITEEPKRSYCLFSEVLLGALRGEVLEAIETEYHQFKPAVTNHKLEDYLQAEVRTRAAAIGEYMEPDISTGIHPPYNFYRLLKEPIPNVMPNTLNPKLAEAIKMAVDRSPEKYRLSEVQNKKRQILLYKKRQIEDLLTEDLFHRNYSTICDFRPDFVALPSDASVEVVKMEYFGDFFYKIIVTNCQDGAPILIHQGNKWLLTPYYPNVITVIFQDLPGDTLFYCPGRKKKLLNEENINRFQYNELIALLDEWDTYLSDFSNLALSSPLRAKDAKKFADILRIGKEKYPHQSVTAGYLYEFSNDYDNIARTAHYMYNNTSLVPFDLALLCAEKIEWRKVNSRFVAFADLPAVERSESYDNTDKRPYYAYEEFDSRKDVRLWGIAPIFSQGWSFMQTELYLNIPETIQQIGKMTSGRSASSLTNKGLDMFLKVFDYYTVETS